MVISQIQAVYQISGNNRYLKRQSWKNRESGFTAVMENESGNKLETRTMIGVLLLVAGLNGVGTIIPNSEQIATACYGSDPCDFYSLQCNSSDRILLGTLQYGSKNDSVCRNDLHSPNIAGHCNYTETCCRYQPGDCANYFTREDTYRAYYNCSGKEKCVNIQSPWTLLQHCFESTTTTSSYVKLQYTCIKETSIIQLNEKSSMTLNSSFVQFDATRNISISSTSRNCTCEIAGVGNDLNNITVEIKDVRLSRLVYVNNVTNCSSARLFIGDSFQESCNSNASHDYEHFVNGKQLYFNVTSNSTLRIRLEDLFLDGEEDIPAMVWLYIEAMSPVNISCNPPPPSPLTTLAPTATTSMTATTTPDVTTTEAVTANESSISTQTSIGTIWNSSDTTLLSTTTGEMTDHTNMNDNITTLSTASSSPATYTLISTTQDLNKTSGSTTIGTTEGQISVTNQAQAGNVSQAWVYTGIGIGVGVLILLVLGGLIIYINRSLAHSYELHNSTNGHLLKDKGSGENMSASRMAYMESNDF